MITLQLTPPTAAAYCQLRAECGWGEVSLATATKALSSSLIDVTAWREGQLVGMGRVVGDGVLYFYLQDVVVRQEAQNQSIGRMIVEQLMKEITKRAQAGATIGLMSADGKESFYENFGFEVRPTNQLGAGMTQFIL